jgi:CRP-like cAMP-binding protein
MELLTERANIRDARRRCLDLAGLPYPESEELIAMSEFRTYADGAEVFAQGEAMPGVFLVVRGTLKVLRTNGRSKVQIIDILHPGACIGQVEALDGGHASCGAEALGQTDCWLIPPEALRLMASRNTAVAMWMLQCSADRIRKLVSLVDSLSLSTVPERVARLILELQGRNPQRPLVEFSETQEEAAQCIGASREAFSRALRTLADLGMIKNSFPVVRILNLTQMQRFARERVTGPHAPAAVGPLGFHAMTLFHSRLRAASACS